MVVLIETSPGDLLDKITILEIKKEQFTDPHKLHNIEVELQVLYQVKSTFAKTVASDLMAEVDTITNELKIINKCIWDIEDGKRKCERENRFDSYYIDLARGVQHNNDIRAKYKRDINLLLDSRIIEEKSFI
jgi:hypothetical protein